MSTRLLSGDCRLILPTLEAESIHACVTDPPYELGFMGKSWDRSGVAFDPETWRAVYDALKPGGHLLAFGGTRTFHRMTVAIEDAGFEIRDCLSWLYGSGFPKSHNLDGEWDGWGTALKPAWEPIILARKPFKTTVAANVTEHGTGAINVDGCRIETDEALGRLNNSTSTFNHKNTTPWVDNSDGKGRCPANVVIDEDAAAAIDAQSGERSSGGGNKNIRNRDDRNAYGKGLGAGNGEGIGNDTGGASRFYYCAKADRSERNAGLNGMAERSNRINAPRTSEDEKFSTLKANHHPTVKPVALMQWLVRMVTPRGGTVLDPFMGSGTTGIAASREGFHFIGIELSSEYLEIARRRIHGDAPLFSDIA